MTAQLIPVFNGTINNELALLCDARDLYDFLNVRRDFSTWIKGRIADYKFIENQDYILIHQFGGTKGRGGDRRSKDYHLTLDTAKELAMVERNEKGRQIRRYFIECEKQLRQQNEHPAPKTSRRTSEPLTPNDAHNLNHLVTIMSSQFRRDASWSRGIWYALRRATGVPSPELFSVSDLPALAEECRRVIQITSAVKEMIVRIETEAVRRIIRNKEECSLVVGQLQREYDSIDLDSGMQQLERFERLALERLEQRTAN